MNDIKDYIALILTITISIVIILIPLALAFTGKQMDESSARLYGDLLKIIVGVLAVYLGARIAQNGNYKKPENKKEIKL